MKLYKAGRAADEGLSGELELVNAFAKAELSDEEVYTFSVLLCDNEVDRDFERFTEKTLAELSELFTGTTGISDHEWKSSNQVARIYRTELVRDTERETSLGTPYTYLKGYAYMLRTEGNAELIKALEGGIKSETSVGCAVARSVCSICGEELGKNGCCHIKGESYGGKLCYAELEGAVDAYEWSFVAVPAQKNAGVIKSFSLASFTESSEGSALRKEYEELKGLAELGRRYLSELRSEVLRLCLVADRGMYAALEKSAAYMDSGALESLRSALEKKSETLYPPLTQLKGKDEVTAFAGDEYII